jgi:aryl-alcohol dehydrogenase-like predicted oxidoreductase
MTLSTESRFQLTPDLSICRILNGMWQVSGAHGRIDPDTALDAMFEYHDSGFTTWDLADHYGPAEDLIGAFRSRMKATRGEAGLVDIQAFTKWVPSPARMSLSTVEAAVDRSRRRMDVETIDVLQFHWWDYDDTNYLEALSHLAELRDKGLIRHLALTNFDTEHMSRIVEHGIRIIWNQVQYSLVDRRPEVEMARFCEEHNIPLLAYGTLLGGLLSEQYLGHPEPRGGELNTASLQKYKQMIDVWGGWPQFQELLKTIKRVADRCGVSMANVAVRYVLDRPAVAGVIVGARLGVSDHREDNVRVFETALDSTDLQEIEAVLAQGRDLYRLIGDCGDEYRR